MVYGPALIPDELWGRVLGGGAVGCLTAVDGVSDSDSGSGTRCARSSADDNTGDSLPSSSDRSGEKSGAAVGAGEVGRVGT